jgi:hypothetical protein
MLLSHGGGSGESTQPVIPLGLAQKAAQGR